MKLFITSILLFALNLSFIVTNASAKNKHPKRDMFHQLPCYAISEDNGSPNILFEYSPATNSWQQIGLTGTSDIEAMAIDFYDDIIYATDGGTIGYIDMRTGVFNTINEFGTGNGEFGQIDLNDIDGLTYDPTNVVLYATHRISGTGPGTNDLLFLIDPGTGKVIKNAMLDANGNPADYAVIEEVIDETMVNNFYDVDDIAWDSNSQLLFALHKNNDANLITILDPYTGKLETVVRDFIEETMGGMTMTSYGKLLLTTQSASNEFCIINGLLDLTDPILPVENPYCYADLSNQTFEAIDCIQAYNDLTLIMELDESSEEPVKIGSEITFLLAVYNQGDLDNEDITLVNYIPDGLTLSDPNWIDTGNGKAYTTINYTLSAVGSHAPIGPTDTKVPITFIVNDDANGQTITNAAEIVSSFNYDIVDAYGNPIPLPDFDSFPDDIQGNDSEDCMNCGPDWGNEIEDDYTFVSITVEQTDNLPILLSNIQPESCDALGSANIQMLFGGVPPFTHQWENIAGERVHDESSSNEQYEVPNLKAGGYYVTIEDAANKINTFSTVIPFMSPLSGSTNCNNTCPEYVVVPNGSAVGNFLAEQVVEIKGYVEKTNNALFDICLQ